MNTHMKRSFIAGLLIATITWLRADTTVYTISSNQSQSITITVPSCAHIEVHGNAYGPPTSYITGNTPIGSFYYTPSNGSLHMMGTVGAGTYTIYQNVGSSGYSCVMVTMYPPDLDESVTTSGGFTSPYTGNNPIGSAFSYGYGPSEPATSGPTPLDARNAIATRIEQLTGHPVSEWQRNRIYSNGCPDVARVFSRTTDGKYLAGYYPERSISRETLISSRWSIKAFDTYAHAQASSCEGARTLIFAIEGAWIGSPPVPSSAPSSLGQVPVASIDPKNYIVRVPGNETMWINVSHGNANMATPEPQVLYVFTEPPPENFPTVRMIFVRICIHD